MGKMNNSQTEIFGKVKSLTAEYLGIDKENIVKETSFMDDLGADSFDAILGDWCAEYSSSFARRAMADIAFTDVDGFYYVVDVKTHRADTKFNMPNLTSVDRLSRFY